MHVLFVCTGNVCRSPTAERLLAAREVPGLTVSSAGTHAVVGHGVQETAAAVLVSRGGDPTGFAARQLTAAMVADADLVLTLAAGHRHAVLQLVPAALRRTFTLREAAALLEPDQLGDEPAAEHLVRRRRALRADELDVPDPIGRSDKHFVTAGALVDEALTTLAPLWRPGRRDTARE